MPKRITVDENGLVVAVQFVPERTATPGTKDWKTEGGRNWKGLSTFKWKPSKGPTPDFSAAGVARRSEQEKRRRAEEKRRREKEKPRRVVEREARRAKAISRGRRRTEQERRAVERLTAFKEAYALGMDAIRASPPDYPLAIAAFSKAYRIDPRRKVRPGEQPNPGLFEVPTRLAAAYRLNGQPHKARKMYEWVLEHFDNRFARMGLATVHADEGRHAEALRLYESVLADDPNNRYALRGVARTLAKLGRNEEAREAYRRALLAASD